MKNMNLMKNKMMNMAKKNNEKDDDYEAENGEE